MPHPTTTPSALPRDALARELLEVICPANAHLANELDYWLALLAGGAGHLASAQDAAHFHREGPGSPDEVAALGFLLQKAANIARALAAGLREGAQ